MSKQDKHYFRDYRARKRREREAHSARQVPATVLAALLDTERREHEATTRELQTISYGWGDRKLIGERSADEIAALREAAEARVAELRAWERAHHRDFPDAEGMPDYRGPYTQGALDSEAEQMKLRELLALEDCLAELCAADAIEGVG